MKIDPNVLQGSSGVMSGVATVISAVVKGIFTRENIFFGIIFCAIIYGAVMIYIVSTKAKHEGMDKHVRRRRDI